MVGLDPTDFGWGAAFAQFRGVSPFVKSLRVIHVTFPPSQLSDLILSFPLLEDLSVINCYRDHLSDAGSTAIQSSNLPMFTGSLDLLLRGGMKPVVHRLLSIPGDIRFRKLTLRWFCKEDILLTIALVEKCSHTLESLDITDDYAYGTSIGHPMYLHGSNLLLPAADPMSAPFSLSGATKLRDVVFRPGSLRVGRISLVLRVISREHRDLRRVSVDEFYNLSHLDGNEDLRQVVGEVVLEEWLDLDRILVRLWESLSVRTNVIWTGGRREGVMRGYVECFLPEMMKRGMVTVNLVD